MALFWPGLLGPVGAALLDGVFLPTLATIAAIEIVAGRNWKNLNILAGLVRLSLANGGFHLSVLLNGNAVEASRAGVAIYVMLIAIIGGRGSRASTSSHGTCCVDVYWHAMAATVPPLHCIAVHRERRMGRVEIIRILKDSIGAKHPDATIHHFKDRDVGVHMAVTVVGKLGAAM